MIQHPSFQASRVSFWLLSHPPRWLVGGSWPPHENVSSRHPSSYYLTRLIWSHFPYRSYFFYLRDRLPLDNHLRLINCCHFSIHQYSSTIAWYLTLSNMFHSSAILTWIFVEILLRMWTAQEVEILKKLWSEHARVWNFYSLKPPTTPLSPLCLVEPR